MNLKTELAALKSSDLTFTERAEVSCQLAKKLEKTGEYDAACEALSEFWPDRHQPPSLAGLDEATKAEVLLRVGALSGWQGDADQAEGSHENAKDLITRAIETFEELGRPEKAAEGHGDLALCYWREGSYDEARVHIRTALHLLPERNDELRAILLIRAGIIEVWAKRLNEALRFYDEANPLVERSEDHSLKGSFHFEYGHVLGWLAAPDNREDYLDRALIEYAASSFHYEQAGNERALARVETNLGYLSFTIGRYSEAHKHLDRARYLFLGLKDIGTAAKVDETRARTLLAEGRLLDAERTVRSAIKTLQKGGEQAVLAEALTTHATVLARLGNSDRARAIFQQAVEVAETAGDLEDAGRANLSIIEELGAQISGKDLATIYRSAIELLKDSQDPSTGKRLISCAAKILDAFELLEPQREVPEGTWEGFSLKRHVRAGERAVIEKALRDAGGSVTKASRLLGFKHHQSLISLIETRHRDLLKARSTVRRRRHHIVSKRKKVITQVPDELPKRPTTPLSILHVQDNERVARVIGEMLGAEHWHVELCADGDSALRKLFANDHYDALVIDNDLPGITGLELVRRARKITHRRSTPIIMLSGDDIETDAWRAGVKAFLRKPEGVDQVASTIDRLLKQRKERAE